MAKTTLKLPFSLLFFTSLTLTLAILTLTAAETAAYPTIPGTTPTGCSLSDEVVPTPVRREVYENGEIYDITHRITSDMPSFGSKEGLGQYLWLPKSIKNGSLANNSEMKLPSHTGTHVDAPGHVFDHYFDAGYDVDTLDLGVLNGNLILLWLYYLFVSFFFFFFLVCVFIRCLMKVLLCEFLCRACTVG